MASVPMPDKGRRIDGEGNGGRMGLCVDICQYYETSLLCAFQAEFFKAQAS
jgi:hypothetical protein